LLCRRGKERDLSWLKEAEELHLREGKRKFREKPLSLAKGHSGKDDIADKSVGGVRSFTGESMKETRGRGSSFLRDEEGRPRDYRRARRKRGEGDSSKEKTKQARVCLAGQRCRQRAFPEKEVLYLPARQGGRRTETRPLTWKNIGARGEEKGERTTKENQGSLSGKKRRRPVTPRKFSQRGR